MPIHKHHATKNIPNEDTGCSKSPCRSFCFGTFVAFTSWTFPFRPRVWPFQKRPLRRLTLNHSHCCIKPSRIGMNMNEPIYLVDTWPMANCPCKNTFDRPSAEIQVDTQSPSLGVLHQGHALLRPCVQSTNPSLWARCHQRIASIFES